MLLYDNMVMCVHCFDHIVSYVLDFLHVPEENKALQPPVRSMLARLTLDPLAKLVSWILDWGDFPILMEIPNWVSNDHLGVDRAGVNGVTIVVPKITICCELFVARDSAEKSFYRILQVSLIFCSSNDCDLILFVK